jgi:RHS repeat-associated protein
MAAVLAAKENTGDFPLAAAAFCRKLASGSSPSNLTLAPGFEAAQVLPSLPGTAQVYGGIAVGRLVGLDYADQRYHNPGTGRFMTPDHYRGSPAEPSSFNRYAYVGGDPINRTDPTGQCGEGWSGVGDFSCWIEQFLNSEPGIDPCFDEYGYDVCFYSMPTTSDIVTTSIVFLQMMQEEQRNFTQAQSAFRNAATSIAGTTTWGTECEKDFAALGVTDSAMQAGASTAQFLDGVRSNVPEANLYIGAATPETAAFGAGMSGTVGESIAARSQSTIAESELGGNQIYLNGQLISGLMNGSYRLTGGAVFDITAIAMHEILHNITGLGDSQLQSRLGIPASGVTDSISQKLRTDCLQ